MIKFCVRLVQRWLPEPFIFAILLTFVAAILAMPICNQTPLEVVEHWGGGVWSLLAFAMQMVLVLVCGSALAAAPAVKRAVTALARIPKSPAAAIALVTVVSALACWLNWGFGLIVGVIFAKEIARQLQGVDYRLLIASAYSGFVVWHAGLSGSIPLTMATPGDALAQATGGVLASPIPVGQTILDPHNIVMVLLVIVGITVANTLMHPKQGAVVVDSALLADDDTQNSEFKNQQSQATPAQRMERSPILSWIIALLMVAYLVVKLGFRGGSLDLGIVIMIFLSLGLMLHGTPLAYVHRRQQRRQPRQRHLRRLYQHLQPRNLSAAHLPQRCRHQRLRPVGRRAVGGAGTHHVPCGSRPWRRPRPHRHSHRLGRRLDQPHPALLGPPGPGHRQTQRPRHHGFLSGRPYSHRNHHLRRPPRLGAIVYLFLIPNF